MMTKDEMKTGIQKAVGLSAVPKDKFGVMVKKTVVGGGLVALGVMGMARFGFPWYAGLGCSVLGATVWSGQVVTGAVTMLLGPVKAYRRAFKDGGDA